MFLGLPIDQPEAVQRIVLILNTVLLISALLVFEFLFAHASKKKKKQLRLFYPGFAVMCGILAYAVYVQGAA